MNDNRIENCSHVSLFGTCVNKDCEYSGQCDGKRHRGHEEEIDELPPEQILDGDCCVYFG